MQSYQIEQVTCSCCHQKGTMKVWPILDVVSKPELKDKLLNNDLFYWKCDNCGEEFDIPYKTIYQDDEHRFILFFSPFDDDTDTFIVPQGEIAEKILPGYVFRTVFGMQQLSEKILIFEAGLNDIAIERIKFFQRLEDPDNIQPNDKIFFWRVDTDPETIKLTGLEQGSLTFLKVRGGEEPMVLSYPMEQYYDQVLFVKSDFRMKVERGDCVDEVWIERKLQK